MRHAASLPGIGFIPRREQKLTYRSHSALYLSPVSFSRPAPICRRDVEPGKVCGKTVYGDGPRVYCEFLTRFSSSHPSFLPRVCGHVGDDPSELKVTTLLAAPVQLGACFSCRLMLVRATCGSLPIPPPAFRQAGWIVPSIDHAGVNPC